MSGLASNDVSSNNNNNKNDSLFQVMNAVEAAEAIIKQQVEENARLRTEIQKKIQELDKYVGGWTQVYDDILTYATIRGASHMAPFSSPKRSLALFTACLAGKPLPEAKSN